MPPINSEMPIATGVVTDLGASDNCVSILAPKNQAILIELKAPITIPEIIVINIGSQACFSLSNCWYKGMAKATVAGPSKKWMNCPPSK